MTGSSQCRSVERPKRVLIVDDHPLVREGLALHITRHPDLEVCGEAADEEDALNLVKTTRPDLVIVDISLRSGHGLDLIERIRQHDRHIRMLVFSMHDESAYAQRALHAGALGYIHKQECHEKVLMAIRRVLDGQCYLSPQMTERLLGQAIGKVGAPDLSPDHRLSNRELEVFQLIGDGLTTNEIAQRLHLSVHTIDSHREKIKAKLRIKTSTELIRAAVQWVLAQLPP